MWRVGNYTSMAHSVKVLAATETGIAPQRIETKYAILANVCSMRGRPLKRQIVRYPNRIKELRNKLGLSQEALADRVGLSYQQVGKLERGDQRLKTDQLVLFAEALGVTPPTLLPSDSGSVPVVGYVGAGAEIFPVDDHARGQGLDRVRAPAGMEPRDTVAVRIRGDSMLPLEDGWLLFYSRREEATAEEIVGHLCVVKLAGDGPTLVKKVRPGYRRGRFNLLSTNADPIEDVELEWAARVRAVVCPDLGSADEAA